VVKHSSHVLWVKYVLCVNCQPAGPGEIEGVAKHISRNILHDGTEVCFGVAKHTSVPLWNLNRVTSGPGPVRYR
jgi:hypothetical protein